jgi:cytochrome d ubiquinol oxidase subunit II
MELGTLQLFGYIVFISSLFAYAALDGFDIGVGCLHLLARNDLERRIFLNAIGPVWDGNSLWVIITAGGLLAAFPSAFATLLSTLYLPMLLLVCGYVLRSVAIEFRSKLPSPRWRNGWDCVFALASFCLAFGFGVILANLITGLPIDQDGNLVSETGTIFSAYALLLGVFTTCLFMLHGALYLHMKTEGVLQKFVRDILQNVLLAFFFIWSLLTVLTLIYQLDMTEIFRDQPQYLSVVFIALIGMIAIPKLIHANRDGLAFLSSFLIIASLVLTYALGTYPAIVRAQNVQNSLTIYNASASMMTLNVFFIIACLGVPLFLFYACYTYKVFRGKVELNTMSY